MEVLKQLRSGERMECKTGLKIGHDVEDGWVNLNGTDKGRPLVWGWPNNHTRI